MANQVTSSLIDPSGFDVQPAWLSERRSAAARRFEEIGFPTRRDEEWRSTPIAPIVETPFALPEEAAIDRTLIDSKRIDGAYEVVFVNRRYAPELSHTEDLPGAVVVLTLQQAIVQERPEIAAHLTRLAPFENHAFAALNTASITDGVFISIPKNAILERPIHLIYASQPGAEATVSHPRTLIVAAENSEATVIERFEGAEEAVYLTNAVTEAVIAENARVTHYKVQLESKAAFHMHSIGVELEASSVFQSHSFGFGGAIARNDVAAAMRGEYAEATLNGLFLAKGRQLMDSHTTIDHAVPNCPSHELYKHIMDNNSRGVFNGKIFVRLDAQKTDAKQTNQTLLLSPNAQVDTKPQLEIFADDVRCTHGATVGQLSPEQMFYLQSRGIGKEQARDLLIYAFASANVGRVAVEGLREELDRILLTERHIEGLD